MEFRLPTRLELTALSNGVEVSTVNLQSAAVGSMVYETCVFYPNGNSNVVARYATEEEALTGHRFIAGHEKLHAIHEARWPRVFPGL